MSISSLKLNMALKLADRVSAPAKNVSSSVRQMSERMRETNEQLSRVRSQTKQVGQLQKLEERLAANSSQLQEAREQAEQYRRAMEEAGADAPRKYADNLRKAENAVSRLTGKQTELEQKAAPIRETLSSQGVDTANLAEEKSRLAARTEELSDTYQRQRRQMARLREMPRRLEAGWNRARTAISRARQVLVRMAGVAAGAGAAGIAAAVPGFRAASQAEQLETQLIAVEGTAERAGKAMEWIRDHEGRTPFGLEETTNAYTRLRTHGIDPAGGAMDALANAAAAMGGDMNQAARIYTNAIEGNARALRELGVQAEQVDDRMRFTFQDQEGNERTIEAMADDREHMAEAIQRVMDESFAGAMDHYRGTWQGIWGELTGHWEDFQRLVMESGPFDKLRDRAKSVLEQLDRMAESGELERRAERVGDRLVRILDTSVELARETRKLGERAAHAAGKVAHFVGGWENLALILVALKILPVISMLTGLASALALATRAALPLSRAIWRVSSALIFFSKTAAVAAISGSLRLARAMTVVRAVAAGAAVRGIAGLGRALWVAGKASIPMATGAFSALGRMLVWIGRLAVAHPKIALITALAAGALYVVRNWEKVQAFFNQVFGDIRDDFQHSVIHGIANTILDWNPVGVLWRVFSGVLDFFGVDLPSRLSDVVHDLGRSIASGIGAGLKSAFPNLYESMRGLIDRIPEGVRDYLGINSPSRVMMDIGEDTVSGLQVGIERRAANALGAMRSLGERLPQAGPAFAAAGMAAGTATADTSVAPAQIEPVPAVVSAEPAPAGDTVMNVTLNIYPREGMDAQDVAREARRELQRLQRDMQRRSRSRLHDED